MLEFFNITCDLCFCHVISKIMKVSQRFEQLMQQRRQQPDGITLTDQDLLQEIVSRYNSYKANAALKRWQVTPDQVQAILGIVVGMSAESRELVRSHLDWNKWEQSGYLDSFKHFDSQICYAFVGTNFQNHKANVFETSGSMAQDRLQ